MDEPCEKGAKRLVITIARNGPPSAQIIYNNGGLKNLSGSKWVDLWYSKVKHEWKWPERNSESSCDESWFLYEAPTDATGAADTSPPAHVAAYTAADEYCKRGYAPTISDATGAADTSPSAHVAADTAADEPCKRGYASTSSDATGAADTSPRPYAPKGGWIELLASLHISDDDRVALEKFGIASIFDLKMATEGDLVEAGLKTFQARKLFRGSGGSS